MLAAWIAASAAVLSAVIVFGQVLVQRRQRYLEDAEAHRQQSAAWADLAGSWELALLPAAGAKAISEMGVTDSDAEAYFDAVEKYRLASVAWLGPLTLTQSTSSAEWEQLATDDRAAREALAPYRRAVQRIVIHLAQVSGLVLRNRLSLDAAYDAFGLPLIRTGDDLLGLLRCSFDHGSSCPAPGNAERSLWKALPAEQVSVRIGWGAFLDVARGTAERIVLFLDMLRAHAIEVGDLDGGFDSWHGESDDKPPVERDRLAIAWRAARRHGLLRAINLTRRLAASSRRVSRRRRWSYPTWFVRAVEKVGIDQRKLPMNGWMRVPRDLVLVPVDVVRAAWRSRTVPDLRRMDPPTLAAKNFGLEANQW